MMEGSWLVSVVVVLCLFTGFTLQTPPIVISFSGIPQQQSPPQPVSTTKEPKPSPIDYRFSNEESLLKNIPKRTYADVVAGRKPNPADAITFARESQPVSDIPPKSFQDQQNGSSDTSNQPYGYSFVYPFCGDGQILDANGICQNGVPSKSKVLTIDRKKRSSKEKTLTILRMAYGEKHDAKDRYHKTKTPLFRTRAWTADFTAKKCPDGYEEDVNEKCQKLIKKQHKKKYQGTPHWLRDFNKSHSKHPQVRRFRRYLYRGSNSRPSHERDVFSSWCDKGHEIDKNGICTKTVPKRFHNKLLNEVGYTKEYKMRDKRDVEDSMEEAPCKPGFRRMFTNGPCLPHHSFKPWLKRLIAQEKAQSRSRSLKGFRRPEISLESAYACPQGFELDDVGSCQKVVIKTSTNKPKIDLNSFLSRKRRFTECFSQTECITKEFQRAFNLSNFEYRGPDIGVQGANACPSGWQLDLEGECKMTFKGKTKPTPSKPFWSLDLPKPTSAALKLSRPNKDKFQHFLWLRRRRSDRTDEDPADWENEVDIDHDREHCPKGYTLDWNGHCKKTVRKKMKSQNMKDLISYLTQHGYYDEQEGTV